MKQTKVLVGSGEFTGSMEEVDKEVLSYFAKASKDAIVAIVPLAAKKEKDYWKWVDDGVKHFRKLGIEAYGAETAEELKKANVVYFSGGDPGNLLEEVRARKLWPEVVKKEIIFGSSAGAILLGEWVLANIYDVIDRGETKLRWERGMGVVPYMIWPHFDWARREMPGKMEELMGKAPEGEWLGIDEDTAVVWPYFAHSTSLRASKGSAKILGRGIAHWGKM